VRFDADSAVDIHIVTERGTDDDDGSAGELMPVD